MNQADLQKAFQSGELNQVLELVKNLTPVTQPNGSQMIADFLGKADCVRYVAGGIAFQKEGREITAPADDEVTLLTTSVSLCGTDLDLIKKAQANQLPPESMDKVVGHEAAGVIVGLGKNVTEWQIGQLVCLDSHFACARPEHHHFDECVASGQSCDGIVGGIRGALQPDGQRQAPRDGYWSRVITVPVSALPVPLAPETAQHLTAPSTLESLGNIYMIIGKLAEVGLTQNTDKSILVVGGLGATGYPLAAVSKHYGFQVWGINPSEGKRVFAEKAGACDQTMATTQELLPKFQAALKDGVENLIIVVMSGDQGALKDALAVLNDPSLSTAQHRACVAFGLFADAQAPMPGMPASAKPMAQRDFVFSRQSYTSEQGVEVYGVCGRDLKSWKTLMKDLEPDSSGNAPQLTQMLNKAIYSLPVADPLQAIAEALNKGPDYVNGLLKEHQALKLAANLVVKDRS
jgi:threonine dehydrogenase-like Zn-dependent dehydrogenase